VVQARLGKEIEHRSGRAGLGVGRAEHHAREPRMQHGTGAHRAGLERHEQLAAVEPVVAERGGGGAQGVDFGMRTRVVLRHGRVAAGGDDLPVLHQHRADRHLAGFARPACLGQGQRHPARVVGLRRQRAQLSSGILRACAAASSASLTCC
jgi:hypothetical protein